MKIYYESKPGELQHGWLGNLIKPKTSTKPKKYIEKIKMPSGKYRYFYTQEELDAYNATVQRTKQRSDDRQKKLAAARNNAYRNDLTNNPEYTVITDYNNDLTGKTYKRTSGTRGDRYGTFERENETGGTDYVERKKSNKLFSSARRSETIPTSRSTRTNTFTTYEDGLLAQNARYTADKLKTASKKAKKKLDKILNSEKKKKKKKK